MVTTQKPSYNRLNASLVSEDLEKEKDGEQEEDECEQVLFNEDVASYTFLSLYKPNIAKFDITKEKQSELMKTCLFVLTIQFVFINILHAATTRDFKETIKKPPADGGAGLFIIKVMTSTTMHLVIFRFFKNGLNIMKFVNNHADHFNLPFFCYLMGFYQVFLCLYMESMNVIILYS